MLHRKLVRLTGKSPSELITDTRLSRAYELITNETATISEIAYLVGYTSPSYFNRVFRKRYHCSPGEVRKNLSGKINRRNINPGSPDREQARILKQRYFFFIGTKIVVVLLVAAAAGVLLLKLTDILTPLLGLPEQTLNQMIVLVISGFILSVFLSLVYYVRSAVSLGRTRFIPGANEEETTRISSRAKIASYISILVIVAFFTVKLIEKNHW